MIIGTILFPIGVLDHVGKIGEGQDMVALVDLINYAIFHKCIDYWCDVCITVELVDFPREIVHEDK